MQNFEERLKGGHPNSLGNTLEVVDEVIQRHEHFEELFNCYQSKDEVVRLRTSNAMKRICQHDQHILVPYIDRFLHEVAKLDQPSAQWTIAQLFDALSKRMNDVQVTEAKNIMLYNLQHSNDWIVLNMTMETLSKWAKEDENLLPQITPRVKQLADDPRKSVAAKAKKTLRMLSV